MRRRVAPIPLRAGDAISVDVCGGVRALVRASQEGTLRGRLGQPEV